MVPSSHVPSTPSAPSRSSTSQAPLLASPLPNAPLPPCHSQPPLSRCSPPPTVESVAVSASWEAGAVAAAVAPHANAAAGRAQPSPTSPTSTLPSSTTASPAFPPRQPAPVRSRGRHHCLSLLELLRGGPHANAAAGRAQPSPTSPPSTLPSSPTASPAFPPRQPAPVRSRGRHHCLSLLFGSFHRSRHAASPLPPTTLTASCTHAIHAAAVRNCCVAAASATTASRAASVSVPAAESGSASACGLSRMARAVRASRRRSRLMRARMHINAFGISMHV